MPLWFRRILFVLISVLTLGIVTPTYLYEEKADEISPTIESEQVADELEESQESGLETVEANTHDEIHSADTADSIDYRKQLEGHLVAHSVYQAEVQGFKKFGPTITNKVGDEYRRDILPKIEEVVATLSEEVDENTLRNLVVSEVPARGEGEKIFHIYDGRNGTDLVRFHVRRDHPPKQGYWFNFHYHTQVDNSENHHELGKIYWDKNTPPKWMA